MTDINLLRSVCICSSDQALPAQRNALKPATTQKSHAVHTRVAGHRSQRLQGWAACWRREWDLRDRREGRAKPKEICKSFGLRYKSLIDRETFSSWAMIMKLALVPKLKRSNQSCQSSWGRKVTKLNQQPQCLLQRIQQKFLALLECRESLQGGSSVFSIPVVEL